MCNLGRLAVVVLLALSAVPLAAQVPVPPVRQLAPPSQLILPPATRLEAFTPVAGSILTTGYDHYGRISGVSVDVREVRDARGGARGLVVDVRQSPEIREQAFVDAEEVPELLKTVEAFLGLRANPTSFKMFEVLYSTRGELQLTAFSDNKGSVFYAVQAGRIERAQCVLDAGELLTLRGFLDAASQKLNAMSK